MPGTSQGEEAAVVRAGVLRLELGGGQQEILKWIAIASMVLDHAVRVLDVGTRLHPLGRLAFPLFAILLAYNVACRGVPPRKYHRPLLLFALVAQPAYSLAFDTWQLNILFTLLLATLALDVIERAPEHLQPLALVALAVLAIPVDYSLPGWLLILLMVQALREPTAAAFGGIVFLTALVNIVGGVLMGVAGVLALGLPYLVRSVPAPKLPRNRWVFYVFYPGHLYALLVIDARLAA